MKNIKYKILDNPKASQEENYTFSFCIIPFSETNEAFVKKVAYNGEYEIIEDEKTEPIPMPTQLDRIEAQITYTAMMTDTLMEE